MKQIKASELLKNLSYNLQKSFIDEDKHIIPVIEKIRQEENNITYDTILKVLRVHDEFIRFALIKTIIQTLIDNALIENDIQVFNNQEFDIMCSHMIEQAVADDAGWLYCVTHSI